MVKFNRPSNANALGTQAMDDLLKALRWADEDSDVKVVVLSGEGKFFSAGMDLLDVPSHGPVLPDEGIEILRYALAPFHHKTKHVLTDMEGRPTDF